MKLIQINDGCGVGSIGKICVSISELLTEQNFENYIYYSYDKSSYSLGIKYTNEYYIKFQALVSRITGNYGFTSKYATKKLIKNIDSVKPDVIHLHNLHGHNVHLEMLFNYIRKNSIKVYWTFHDCWAFTGYCPHFTMAGCDKWKSGCGKCPQKKQYTWFFDKSSELWKRKKAIFEGIDLTIITPSKWMSSLVKQSFFKNCPVHVINNGVDLNVFKPTKSEFRKKYGCENKNILLGVAFGWGLRKGLDVFIELSKILDDKYQIILVGTDGATDKILPQNIISIHRTKNQKELAEIYTVADLFVNPTREDTFPTVNMEAIVCGTSVISYDIGGSKETIREGCGICLKDNSIQTLAKEIEDFFNNKSKCSECIQNRDKYDHKKSINQYYQLYNEAN